VKRRRPSRCANHFEKLGLSNALIVDGAKSPPAYARRPQYSDIDVLPIAGINVLRHPAGKSWY